MPNTEGIKDRFDRVEHRRFPALVALGGGLGAVVVIVAFISDAGLAWPLLILFALCLAVAVVYRLPSRDPTATTPTTATPCPSSPRPGRARSGTRPRPTTTQPAQHPALQPRASRGRAAGGRGLGYHSRAPAGRRSWPRRIGRRRRPARRTEREGRRDGLTRRAGRRGLPALALTRWRADDGRPLAPQPVPRGYRRGASPAALPRGSRGTPRARICAPRPARFDPAGLGASAAANVSGDALNAGGAAMKSRGGGSPGRRCSRSYRSIYRRGSERSTRCATSSCFSTTPYRSWCSTMSSVASIAWSAMTANRRGFARMRSYSCRVSSMVSSQPESPHSHRKPISPP